MTRKRTPNARTKPDTSRARAKRARQDAFLEAFTTTGIISSACEIAEVGRSTHYEWLADDADYQERFFEAREDAADVLESEARRRALEGVDEPIYQAGKLVGYVRRYSDRLLERQLEAHRPEIYSRRHQITGAGGDPLIPQMSHEEQVSQLTTKVLGLLHLASIEGGSDAE